MYWTSLEIGSYSICIYVSSKKVLNEAIDRGVKLTGVYSYTKHPPHTRPGQYHLHVLKKGNQIFALNQDGTAHDQSHGCRIPNKVAAELRNIFPDWKIPENNLIEYNKSNSLMGLLIEGLNEEIAKLLKD